MSQNNSIGVTPFSYLTGLALAWASTTTLTVGTGQCRDSNNNIDMPLNALATINAAATGANGLDTGALANNTWYYVFLIASSTNLKPVATLISTSASAPLSPQGYDSFRRIGTALTNGSAQFLKFYTFGGASRIYFYDAPIAITPTAATSYTAQALTAAVPPTAQVVKVNYKLTPASAGNSVLIRPTGSTATTNLQFFGPVAAQPVGGLCDINTNGSQSVDLKFSSASDALVLNIAGYEEFL